MPETVEVVDTCGWAFSEPEDERRAQLLERCFADDAVFASPPTGVAVGREAINSALGALHAQMPAVHVVRTTGIDEHHGRVRFQWKVLGAEGAVMFDRVDITGELAGDGRICRMAAFMGPPPQRQ